MTGRALPAIVVTPLATELAAAVVASPIVSNTPEPNPWRPYSSTIAKPANRGGPGIGILNRRNPYRASGRVPRGSSRWRWSSRAAKRARNSGAQKPCSVALLPDARLAA